MQVYLATVSCNISFPTVMKTVNSMCPEYYCIPFIVDAYPAGRHFNNLDR